MKSKADFNKCLGTDNLEYHRFFKDLDQERTKRAMEIREGEKKNATLKSAMKMMEEKLLMTEEYKEKEMTEMKKGITETHEKFEETIKRLKQDNDKLNKEKNDLKYELDSLTKKFDEYKQVKNLEIQSLNSVYELKLRELDINDDHEVKLTTTTNHPMNPDSDITKMMKRHYEENKSLQDAIKELIQTNNQEKQGNLKQKEKEIEQSNETIAKLTDRNTKLEKRLKETKIYYRLYKHGQSLQGKYCNKFYPSSVFMTHTQTCSIGGATQSETVNLANMDISITQTLIREDENLRKPFTMYVIRVDLDGDNWVVQRKYKEFGVLNENLINHYPNVKFPSTSAQFTSKSLKDIVKKKKTAVVEDRRKTLQRYLNSLGQIPTIRDSDFFKDFLGISYNNSIKPILEENLLYSLNGLNSDRSTVGRNSDISEFFELKIAGENAIKSSQNISRTKDETKFAFGIRPKSDYLSKLENKE